MRGMKSSKSISKALNFFRKATHLNILDFNLPLNDKLNIFVNLNNTVLQDIAIDITSFLDKINRQSTVVLKIDKRRTNYLFACENIRRMQFRLVEASYLNSKRLFSPNRNAIIIKCDTLQAITINCWNVSNSTQYLHGKLK